MLDSVLDFSLKLYECGKDMAFDSDCKTEKSGMFSFEVDKRERERLINRVFRAPEAAKTVTGVK